jgi:hypothetical protein
VLQLPFTNDSFDWVVETGALCHIRLWPQPVVEMARGGRYGVLISATNNIGQGQRTGPESVAEIAGARHQVLLSILAKNQAN